MEAIKVNLIPNGIPEACHASQYDEGRQIRLDLFDGLTPYTIQAGDTFTLNVRKPDNHVITQTVTGTEGNTYLVIETSEQMTAVTGENLCEIRLENGGDNIGSLNFIMQVEKDVIANGIPSESVIEDLQALVAEAVGDNYYTKTETDELLAQKADVTDLLDLLPTDNASGTIANFTDGANDVPVKALSVEFAASQASGTPTPAAPIPIVGVDKVNVVCCGKNLAFSTIANCYIDSAGKIVSSNSYFMAVAPVKSGVEYKVNSPTLICGFFTSMPELNSVSYNAARLVQNNTVFTAPITGYVACRFDTGVTQYQIETGDTTTTYEPYNGTTALINLGGTYYGGEVDALSGEISEKWKIFDLGDLTFNYNSTKQWFSLFSFVTNNNLVMPESANTKTNGLCSIYVSETQNNLTNDLTIDNSFAIFQSGSLIIRDLAYTDPTQFKAAHSGQKLIFELAAPATAQASNAIELNTLLGDNNIFSDAGDVDVTIRADIALYIQKMLGGNVNRSLGANPSILRTGAISTDIEVRKPDSEPVELEREVTEQPENEGNDNEER